MIRKSSDGAALINTAWIMFPVDKFPAPPNVLLLCGNINSGKTVISTWGDKFNFTHWSALPVFEK